jgi:hypothetical protein
VATKKAWARRLLVETTKQDEDVRVKDARDIGKGGGAKEESGRMEAG